MSARGMFGEPMVQDPATTIRILRENYHDSIAMTPANLLMIRVHLVTGLALIVGYALHLAGM